MRCGACGCTLFSCNCVGGPKQDKPNLNKCFELCKLCSWSGAAQAFCNMKWQDQIQTVADLRAYLSSSQRSGQWYVENLIAAVEKFRPVTGGSAPQEVKGAGHMLIGHTVDGYVCIEFHDPDWWLHLTPAEAKNMARLIANHANELEKGPPCSGQT